jgi:flagellar biosynthesis/type III secretory pathway chaperone
MIKGFKDKLFKQTDELTVLLKSVLSCMNSLVEVTGTENKAIEQGQVATIAPLIEKKYSLTLNLQNLEVALAPHAGELQNVQDRDVLEKIKSAYSRLEELNQRNVILLQSSIEVSKMVIKIQKEKQTNQTIQQFGYDNKGEIYALKNLEKVMPAMSLINKI